MTRREGRSTVRRNENVLSFIRPPLAAAGAGALDLVYQAAEIFSGIENNARDMEANAQALCKSAAERVRRAEQRTESAENALRAVIADADRKLSDAPRAPPNIELRVIAAEDKAVAAEIHAPVAQAEAREEIQPSQDAIRWRGRGGKTLQAAK